MLSKIYEKLACQLERAGYDRDELVWGCGPEDSPVVLVGEAPGREEVEKKQPFVGRAGKNLDEFLAHTGLERQALFITNTVKFRPYRVSETGRRSNRPPNRQELALCQACLKEELAYLQPRLVVTLGNTALHALNQTANIGQVHGQRLDCGGYQVFALYHPASIIYRRALYPVYLEDLDKLKEVLKEVL